MIFDLKEEILSITRAYAEMNGIQMNIPDRVNADLRERERLIELAEAHESIPDFSDVSTVREIMPTRLAPLIADLMTVFSMGPHAHRDELMRSCAKIERELFVMYTED